MILTEDLLNALDNERLENNIDREDIIRIVTTYALQSKVSSIEFTLIRSFINKLTKLSDDPEENKKRDIIPFVLQEPVYDTEISQFVFEKPKNKDKVIIEDFHLDKLVLQNERTSIYENNKVRFCFDSKVIRVFILDDSDDILKTRIQKYFYEKQWKNKKGKSYEQTSV